MVFSLEDASGALTINSNTGVITMNDNAQFEYSSNASAHTVTVNITDNAGLSDTHDYTIYVANDDEALGGSSYQMSLQQGEINLSLLEPITSDNKTFYTLDVNEDNQLDMSDAINASQLADYLNGTDHMILDGYTLKLATETDLIDAGLINPLNTSGLSDFNFWIYPSDAISDSFYGLTGEAPLDQDLSEGMVVFHVIG